MADDKITMDIAQMSRTMANAVLRERRRCAQILTDRAALLQETEERRALGVYLTEIAETMLLPPGVRVVPAVPTTDSTDPLVRQFNQLEQEIDERERAETDELPPVRHGDDFEDGVSLVRGMTSFGRRVPGAGIID